MPFLLGFPNPLNPGLAKAFIVSCREKNIVGNLFVSFLSQRLKTLASKFMVI